MVADHFEHFADKSFARQFIPACDGVLEHFARRIDPEIGLIRALPERSDCWDFVDWADQWRPMGITPAAARTGYCTYTSMLYVYTLRLLATMLEGMDRRELAAEHRDRAGRVVHALRTHCFDGKFFTDGLASSAVIEQDYSQHSQIWAVLCGAIIGQEAKDLLKQTLTETERSTKEGASSVKFAPVSIAMTFYTLRAMSMVGGRLYDDHFNSFWTPWKAQQDLNLLTWEEDSVSQRSDCHAWGCAALYEFTREVAGVRPGTPGWEILEVHPRLNLFSSVSIKVPLGSKPVRQTDGLFGKPEVSRNQPFILGTSFGESNKSKNLTSGGSDPGTGVVHVRWQTEENGDIRFSLMIEMDRTEEGKLTTPPPVYVFWPDGSNEMFTETSKEIVRTVKADNLERPRDEEK